MDRQFRAVRQQHTQYYIWNTDFPWTPAIQPGVNCFYVRDAATAPIIEFDRTDVESLYRNGNVIPGRIYWSRLHMTTHPAYDLAKFDKWYDRVIRWVRKQGERVPTILESPYLLPDALCRWHRLRAAEQRVADEALDEPM